MASEEKNSILITIDVEDWFQVENFKAYIEFPTWNFFKLRVESNTYLILDLLDSFPFKPKATFFILGWVAKKLPGLVREIAARGHEVASHGMEHRLCNSLNDIDLKKDLVLSKLVLEDLTGDQVYGFRAPSFAINDRVLKVVENAGYTYDSSYNSFSGHGRYGTIDLEGKQKYGACYKIKTDFFELPITNFSFGKYIFPLGGGGYFRLYPIQFFKLGMKNMLQKQGAFIFYAHPWEFDPDQPKVEEASRGFKFRHYINLKKTERKTVNMITAFSNHKFETCSSYLKNKMRK